jgi:ABC-type multidrug transport system fused ATPase/permease subunit
MPLLISFASFFLYSAVLGNPLTPSLAFTSLSLFNLLKMPLDDLVGMITRTQDTLSSIQRVETFLKEEETEKYVALAQTQHEGFSQIGFEHATISWGDVAERASNAQETKIKKGISSGTAFTFNNLDIHFAVGKLNLIVGATGSGKSSMLLALLGEMNTISGRILTSSTMDRNKLTVDPKTGLVDGVAYCAQEAWLMNDTIRNNITFGSSYVDERYQAVLEACALVPDLHALADGDLTQVGERGLSLSGGQKQRIALARAVYSTAYHILLDDCLGAVDSHTGTWIFEKCLMGPLVRGRTVILATHDIALTGADADFVVVLEGGKIITSGSPCVIRSSHQHPEFENLALRNDDDENGLSRPMISSLNPSMRPIQPTRASLELVQREIADMFDGKASGTDKTENHGSIPWVSVLQYLRSMGSWSFWSLLILAFVGQQVGTIGTNWWIRVLCDAYIARSHERAIQPTESTQDISVAYYFGVYGLIITLFLVVGMARLLLISYGSLHASSGIHTTLTRSIMNARFDFFDKTAFGQIINRFSRDLQMVDQDLAVLAVATLHFLVALLGITTLILIITPAFIVPGIFIGIAYCIIGTLYVGGTRDLKHIDSVQRAPLSQHFSETLSGIATIRAFGAVDQYRFGNLIRIDNANRSSFILAATERWLAVRLGLVGALVSLFAGLFAISTRGKLNPGAIGLSMSYAVVFSEHVLWLIRYHIANLNNIMA